MTDSHDAVDVTPYWLIIWKCFISFIYSHCFKNVIVNINSSNIPHLVKMAHWP
jgi:hypothetical protein